MTIEENLLQFRELLGKCIEIKDAILFPDSPLFAVSQSTLDREITIKEQNLLKNLLVEYERMFFMGKE